MRLVCPNCEAEYEVPDEVVPPEGRDVQCSNCGQTWYQHHPDHVEDVDAPVASELVTNEELDEFEPEIESSGSITSVAPRTPPMPDVPSDEYEDEEQDMMSAPPEPRRRKIDSAVEDILRQEAEIENRARAAERDPLESQPGLGLEDGLEAAQDARRARTSMAALDNDYDEDREAVTTAAAIGARRDLLPDIDEINSSLRNQNETAEPDVEEPAPTPRRREKRERSAFRRGFSYIILLAAIMLLVYVFAPQISEAVPSLDPTLNAYVNWVDTMRAWMRESIMSLLSWLEATAAEKRSS